MTKKILILLTLLLIPILLPAVHAKQGHITLLTIAETANQTKGGTADLYLEIKQGSGRVFMDSFPSTKIDTQISTRYAKQVACSFLERDCSNLDFFYTIRADSNVVGGPSASGAITVITIAMLDNLKLDNETVMTGTINSGGIIGPVGGIKEKTEAAKEAGFKKVLIPKWSIIDIGNITNETKNLTLNITYADTYTRNGIDVIPISNLDEALYKFTGKTYKNYSYPIHVPKAYQKIMKSVAEKLCDRYQSIKKDIPKEVLQNGNETRNTTEDSINKANIAINNSEYYSAASYCFSADTQLRTLQFSNFTNETLKKIELDLRKKVNDLDSQLKEKPLNTLADIETYIIAKERLTETKVYLKENESKLLNDLGYASERFYSAIAWSTFFNYPGEKVDINNEHLKTACLSKIEEAEERLSYLEYLYRNSFHTRDEMQIAKDAYDTQDYAYCLFSASKLKADINAILSTASITKEKLPELVNDKLEQARIQINKQDGKFPILGYSYYNYANNLKDSNPITSELFAEYASELSNLKMYFPKKSSKIYIDMNSATLFGGGVLAGILITLIVIALLIGRVKTQEDSKKTRNLPRKKR